jgi:hypothetical protein
MLKSRVKILEKEVKPKRLKVPVGSSWKEIKGAIIPSPSKGR